jgi:hypothetical protein
MAHNEREEKTAEYALHNYYGYIKMVELDKGGERCALREQRTNPDEDKQGQINAE